MPACPVCGTRRFTVFASAEELYRERVEAGVAGRLDDSELLECGFCAALVREGPPPNASEDELFEGQRRAAATWLRRLSIVLGRRPQRLLEVGVRSTGFLEAVQNPGLQVSGLVTSDEVLVDEDTVPLVRGVANFLPWPDDTFDAVCLWNAALEPGKLRPTLAECRRVLRPGGVLSIRVPNAAVYRAIRAEAPLGARPKSVVSTLEAERLASWPYASGLGPGHLTLLFSMMGLQSLRFFPAAALDSEDREVPEGRRRRATRAGLLKMVRRTTGAAPEWSFTWLEAYGKRPGVSKRLWPAPVPLEESAAVH